MDQQIERKLLLRVTLKLMFISGVLLVAFVLFRYSFKPSDCGEGISIDLSDLPVGKHKIVSWQNRPILILHRTKSMLETIKPDGQVNPFLVVYARSPDYSCPIVMVQSDAAEQDGFKAECSGTLYDFAGRLLPDQNARFNLKKPDYSIEGNILTIGMTC